MAKRHLIKDCGAFTVTSFRNLRSKAEREQAWLEHRTKGVGGSDMSAILGISKFDTPLDIWLSKTGRDVPEKQDSWAIRKGKHDEPLLRDWFRDLHPELEVRDGTDLSLTSRRYPHLLASLDGYLYDPATESFGVLECKTANSYRAQDWRDDDGNPCIPDYYLVQVQHYMAVTGWQWGYVIADTSGVEPLIIRFERDEEDIAAIVNAATNFWRFVESGQMPALSNADDVRKVYPEPTEELEDMSDDDDLYDLMQSYAAAQQQAKEAETKADSLKNQLITRIGPREGLSCGGYKATFKTVHRKGYTKVVEPSDSRVFRFSKTKTKNE